MNPHFTEPENSMAQLTELQTSQVIVPVLEEKRPLLQRRIDKAGQGMTEYILILALIALVAFGLITVFGQQIQGMFGTAVNDIEQANNAAVNGQNNSQ